MIMIRRICLALAVCLLSAGQWTSPMVAQSQSSPPVGGCETLEIEAHAEWLPDGKAISVNVTFVNSSESTINILDDAMLATPFKVVGQVLWYDISSDVYLNLLSPILSPEHLPKTLRSSPVKAGEKLERHLQWPPQDQRDRVPAITQLGIRVSFTRSLPQSEGLDFVRAFGSGKFGCTREVAVPLNSQCSGD